MGGNVMAERYDVFVRTWWKENKSWPNGLEPSLGVKRYIVHDVDWAEARRICKEYNSTHEPGRLSKKAEFESA
jgi:hypothetical protein